MAEANLNIKELDLVTTTMSNKSVAQTGCNSFGLVTTDKDDAGNTVPIMCTGLLTELPSFSISPTYDLSPGKTVLDLYTDVFKKDEFDVAAVLMAASNTNYDAKAFEWQNLIQAGPMTRGMFKSVSYGDFSLKFKVYAQNAFGQSPINEWKALLSKFAAPSLYASTSASTLLNNIEGALSILGDNGETISAELNKGGLRHVEQNESTKRKKLVTWKMKQVYDLLNKFCGFLNGLFPADISIEFMGYSGSAVTASSKSKTFVPIFKIVKTGNSATKSYINTDGKMKNFEEIDKGLFFPDRKSVYWFRLPNGTVAVNAGNQGEYLQDFTESKFYKKTFPAAAADNKSKFKEFLINTLVKDYYFETLFKDKDDVQQAPYQGTYVKLLDGNKPGDERKILNEILDQIWAKLNAYDIEEDSGSFISNLAEHTENILDNVESFIDDCGFLNNYGKNRVYEELNSKTLIGEKLWHLYIYYPWLFNTPITVCITDWSFTPSKQLQADGTPVYHEVEIKCKMDQLPSRERWDDSFSVFCQIAAKSN